MASSVSERHLGQERFEKVALMLSDVTRALTEDIKVESYSCALGSNYYFTDDGVYKTTQNGGANSYLIENYIDADGKTSPKTSSKLTIHMYPQDDKVPGPSKPNSPKEELIKKYNSHPTVYYIRNLDGSVVVSVGPGTGRNNIYSLSISKEGFDSVFEIDDESKKNLTEQEVNSLFASPDALRKIRCNVVHIYRLYQKLGVYNVVSADAEVCRNLQDDIESLIEKRVTTHFEDLLIKLNGYTNETHQKAVKKLLEEITVLAKTNPEHKSQLFAVLESLDALLYSGNNLDKALKNFSALAQSLPGAQNKKLLNLSRMMLGFASDCFVTAAVLFVIGLIVGCFVPMQMPVLCAMLIVAGMLAAIPTAVGTVSCFIGAGMFAAARPTGVAKAILDVSDAVLDETKLVSATP